MAVKASATITLFDVVDVDSVITYYKLQSSTAAVPAKPTTDTPSGWSTTEPTYTEGSTNTLYVVIKTKFSDGTFEYTPVSKSSSYEAAKNAYNKAINALNSINNLKIGGTNIATNTNKGKLGWGWYMGTSGATATLSDVTENNIKCCKMVRNATANTSWAYIFYSYINRQKYLPNRQYTISFEVKASFATVFKVNIRRGNGQAPLFIGDGTTGAAVVNTWTKLSVVLRTVETLPTDVDQVLYLSAMVHSPNTTYVFRNLKIEEGNKATDWSPAPEDSIGDVDVEYYLSTSSTSLAGGSWSTTAPAWVNGKYMWSRTKIVMAGSGAIVYSPSQNGVCIAGAKGNTGNTGATGVGVSTLKELYYLSNSSTTAPAVPTAAVTSTSTGTKVWTTKCPTYVKGYYYWTCTEVLYTNNTRKWTTPLLASGLNNPNEKIENLQIGGRNLGKYGCIRPYNSNAATIVDNSEYKESGKCTITRRGTMNEGPILDFGVLFEAGEEYTISFKMKKISGTINHIQIYNGMSHSNGKVYIDDVYIGRFHANLAITDDTSYHNYRLTFTAKDNTANVNKVNTSHIILQPAKSNNIPYTVELTKFKIEKGNVATDWTPAVEDTNEDLTDLRNKISTAVGYGDTISQIQQKFSDYTLKTVYDGFVSSFNNNVKEVYSTTIGALLKDTEDAWDVIKEFQAIIARGQDSTTGKPFIKLSTGDSNGYSLRIENDQIYIYKGSDPISTWETDEFDVNAIITEKLSLGNFDFVKNSNDGSLSFRKVR